MLFRACNHYRAATPGLAMVALGCGMLIGACIALRLPAAPPGWWCAIAGLAAITALCRAWLWPAGMAFGFVLAAFTVTQQLDDRLQESREGMWVELTGVVEDLPRRDGRRLVFTLRVESPAGLPRRARISWYEPAAVPRPGERWRFRAKLQRPRGAVNSGSASREAWLLRQGIGATGYASGPAGGVLLDEAADFLLRLRGRSAERIESAVSEPRAAAVLIAIALGFRGGLESDTREALAATGTGHLLAISGLHVGLAAAAGGLIGGTLGRRLGRLRRPARDWAAAGALLLASVYCLLAGMPVSARRALLMTAAALWALVARRGHSMSAALGAALVLVLVTDPLAALDPGLWLSFGAVATILAVVAGRLGFPGKLVSLLRIQAALSIGLLACTVAWFGRISLAAPLANLLAVPWFSLFVVPPALLGVALSWLAPTPGGWLLQAAGGATLLALWLIERIAEWPIAARGMVAAAPAAVLLAGIGAGWCLLPRPAPGRAAAVLLFAPMLLAGPAPLAPGAFELRVFDVGHGLAVMLRTRSHVMLYDTGPSWPGGDAAQWSVLPALRASGVRKLDALMISHGHADHAGGTHSVLSVYSGTRGWGGYGAEDEVLQPCRAGLSWTWDGVRFSILHPVEGFHGGLNDGSCVLLVEGPGGRVLLTGDIEARGERALAGTHVPLTADLLIAPHHGSRTSSGPALVASARPAWVVFSTNWNNRWGFPAEVVVDRWQRAGAQPLSTARHGEIFVRFDTNGPAAPVLRRQKECRAWLDCV